jgi:hypothetical protein
MRTRSDVERYLAAHTAILPRGAAVVGSPPTVSRLELVTRTEAEILLNASLARTPGLGKDVPVWYVELRGTFSPANMSCPPGAHWNGTMCHIAILVLDAEGGKALVRALRGDRPAQPAK